MDKSSDPVKQPMESQWNTVTRKSKPAKPAADLNKAALSSLSTALPGTSKSPTTSWASVAAKPAPNPEPKLTSEAPVTQAGRVKLNLHGGSTAPTLARGPGWTQPFSFARTPVVKPPVVQIVEAPLVKCEPLGQTVVEEVQHVTDHGVAEPDAPQARRVSWSDEQDQPLVQIQTIENCLLDKWDWTRCTDLSTREGKTAAVAAAAWYGAIAIGMYVGSYARVF